MQPGYLLNSYMCEAGNNDHTIQQFGPQLRTCSGAQAPQDPRDVPGYRLLSLGNPQLAAVICPTRIRNGGRDFVSLVMRLEEDRNNV